MALATAVAEAEVAAASATEVDVVAAAEDVVHRVGVELLAVAEAAQVQRYNNYPQYRRTDPTNFFQGGQKVIIEPHRHAGVFVARGKEDLLVTKNLTPGEAVYGEKRISIDTPNTTTGDATNGDSVTTKTEYRVWNPFRSKLAAGILGGLEDIHMKPGSKVLYLGAASGTSVSHVADIVGPTGTVFAVEFSHRSGRDLINMATHRTNVIPIVEDARHPLKYRMLVSMVDCIFADVAQPDQARIVGLNAHQFLKVGGGVLISIKASCIDSTASPEAVFAREVVKLREERIKPKEQLTLEPFERDHAMVVGVYQRAG